MRSFLLWGMVSVTAACQQRAKAPVTFTITNEMQSVCFPDTLSKLPRHGAQDILVGRAEFLFCEGHHSVTGWTDDHRAAVDGGSFWLELDSVGQIFRCSTTWPGFEMTRSNSDSLNDLIMMAMAAAARPGHFGVRYPLPSPPTIETVKFIADSVPEN